MSDGCKTRALDKAFMSLTRMCTLADKYPFIHMLLECWEIKQDIQLK